MRLQGRGFHTLIKNVCFVPLSSRCGISRSTPLRDPASSLALIPLSNRCGISQSTPFWGPTSSLVHCLVCFDTIYNNPSPPFADIVLFQFSLKVFKTHLLGRDFHSYKECFVPLSNRRRISQSTPLQGLTSSLALIPLSNRCRFSQSILFRGPTSLLAHRLVCSNIICNSPSPP